MTKRYGLLRWQQEWYSKCPLWDQVVHKLKQYRRRVFGVPPCVYDDAVDDLLDILEGQSNEN